MGIEIQKSLMNIKKNRSYPARGMGIEIMCQVMVYQPKLSYPARGMGIEITIIGIPSSIFLVIPREGYGD